MKKLLLLLLALLFIVPQAEAKRRESEEEIGSHGRILIRPSGTEPKLKVYYSMCGETKAIATVVAVIALLIGGVASYDFNPVSEEQQLAAMEAISDDVYWSPYGKVYHTHDDCQALNQSDSLTYGTVEQAIAENRTRLCSFCAKKDSISGVVTDEAE